MNLSSRRLPPMDYHHRKETRPSSPPLSPASSSSETPINSVLEIFRKYLRIVDDIECRYVEPVEFPTLDEEQLRRIRNSQTVYSSLSELPRDIPRGVLLGNLDIRKDPVERRFKFSISRDWQPIMIEEKTPGAYIYVVTERLARSERALDELSEVVEEKTVLPIFHGVDPSDVRHQTGSFAQAFADHEIKYKDDPQKVKRWRAALTKLGNLSGWHSKGCHETKLIQDVVDEIRWKIQFSKPAIRNLPSTPSWSSSYRRKHDVFLSFRGADTRLAFMGHLHAALIHWGISTFRDDIDLEKGKSIRKQLDKAIEGSKVWVVIVSPDYASSKWCLNELLKILECRKASKVGRKNETLMKPSAEYEEQAHTLVNGHKTHKGKASLRNKQENITNHNKREMGEFRLGVTYGGKWVDSVYIGGRTEEIVVSEDITYSELLDQLYHIVGVHPTENEIKISTIDESKSPAYPVEIINDDDLKNFIDQSLSSDVRLKHPLRNSSRRSIQVRVLVNHDGEWVNSTYVGGKTKGIIIPEDITYQELVDRVCGVVGVDPNEYKLIMKTAYKSNLPTQPVEIIDDEGLAFFIHDENLSLGMSSIFTLCTTLERRAFPNGRMESSHSGTPHLRRFGTSPSCVHYVTPDQVPHLHTQVGPSSPNVPCMQQQQQQQPFYQQQQQQQQQPFYQQQHSFQQTTLQPCYEHYQPSVQQPQPLYQQLHPSYVQQQQSQYQQLNPSYMQPLSPIHHVPYSLKMFWNDATRIFQDLNFWQFSFIMMLLGNIFYFLRLCRNN
ncbi:uncharacterized protein LOC112165907 isoform X2 [Rosa chinensis]|uniref:uncharacterized protein LOC112165907 isoform X2 n=1 Tax=Rosa chinensis TaxID=74649 RepID=UPI000D08794E|nr:uncharacterized protein LOC112165907 isoform X2 [Rosa chinensis]